MAAVYNVPLGGALFALEVLLGTLSLPLVLPALATSLIATAVAWLALPSRPTYIVPTYDAHTSQIVWALRRWSARGACVGGLHPPDLECSRATTERLAQGRSADRRCSPRLGRSPSHTRRSSGTARVWCRLALVGRLAVGVMAVLIVLKPLATAACLGSGAPGGLVHSYADLRRRARRGAGRCLVAALAGRAALGALPSERQQGRAMGNAQATRAWGSAVRAPANAATGNAQATPSHNDDRPGPEGPAGASCLVHPCLDRSLHGPDRRLSSRFFWHLLERS